MRRDPNDLERYTASERVIHWIVGISFILAGLSGLPMFHPAFWPFTMLFGLRPDQLMALHFEPASPPVKPAAEPA